MKKQIDINTFPKVDILILGTGSLSEAICVSLASVVSQPLSVCVVGRSQEKCLGLATIANCRSALFGGKVKVTGQAITWVLEEFHSVLTKIEPRLVVLAASSQSPWEHELSPSKWSSLLKSDGFGLSFPFNAAFAAKLANLISNMKIKPLFVNACYPDAVNPFLKALNLKVDAGLGNIAILSCILENGLKQRSEPVRLLAHHVHVNHWNGGEALRSPLIWVGEARIEDGAKYFSVLKHIRSKKLNLITGATAVSLIMALINRKKVMIHVPGPLGLPGGYPVLISQGKITIDLPQDISLSQAIVWNQKAAEQDGVTITKDKKIRFTAAVKQILNQVSPNLARGFLAKEFEDFLEEFENVRNVLRKQRPC